MSFLTVCFLAIFLITVQPTEAGVTVEQMMQTAQMMRQACQPKFKLSDEEVDGLREKKFPDQKNLKCFVNCVLEMMQVMKKGKIQYENSIKSIQAMMPEELKEDQIQAMTDCKGAPAGIKDNCEASYALLQCQAQKAKNYMFV